MSTSATIKREFRNPDYYNSISSGTIPRPVAGRGTTNNSFTSIDVSGITFDDMTTYVDPKLLLLDGSLRALDSSLVEVDRRSRANDSSIYDLRAAGVLRDASIEWGQLAQVQTDASVYYLQNRNDTVYDPKLAIIDASLRALDSSLIEVDRRSRISDASISYLDNRNHTVYDPKLELLDDSVRVLDSSLVDIDRRSRISDASIAALDASMGEIYSPSWLYGADEQIPVMFNNLYFTYGDGLRYGNSNLKVGSAGESGITIWGNQTTNAATGYINFTNQQSSSTDKIISTIKASRASDNEAGSLAFQVAPTWANTLHTNYLIHDTYQIWSIGGSYELYLDSTAFRPYGAAGSNLGTLTEYWGTIYGQTLQSTTVNATTVNGDTVNGEEITVGGRASSSTLKLDYSGSTYPYQLDANSSSVNLHKYTTDMQTWEGAATKIHNKLTVDDDASINGNLYADTLGISDTGNQIAEVPVASSTSGSTSVAETLIGSNTKITNAMYEGNLTNRVIRVTVNYIWSQNYIDTPSAVFRVKLGTTTLVTSSSVSGDTVGTVTFYITPRSSTQSHVHYHNIYNATQTNMSSQSQALVTHGTGDGIYVYIDGDGSIDWDIKSCIIEVLG